MGESNFYLFADPSFMEGAGQVIDLGGTMGMYNTSGSEREADTRALLSDWKAVGADIMDAMQEYAAAEERA